jgi:hypothetical protein
MPATNRLSHDTDNNIYSKTGLKIGIQENVYLFSLISATCI